MPPVRLLPPPGVDRDLTLLDAEHCSDALWTRWRRGRPRKMGGYQRLADDLGGIARGMTAVNADGLLYVQFDDAGCGQDAGHRLH
jgi:hypothetical protein